MSTESNGRAMLRFVRDRWRAAVATPWALVRALAAMVFVVFAGVTGAGWLQTAVRKPFHSERISVRETYAPAAVEHDLALLRQWLPVEGTVGYWSDLPGFRLGNVRLHLAPLLLDPDWRTHDLVLVDGVAGPHRAEIESPKYELIAQMVTAQSFAGGMQIFRRVAR